MPSSSATAASVRFGPFEVDLRAGELIRNGRRIRLQDQPLQVLAMLLERPGDVVTRDELRQKLWPADTFVDFDHSLNTAVNKIREALGDSASSPRFVETLARRGYRFIAPVQREEAPGSVAQAAGATAQVGAGAANQHLESVPGPVSVRGYSELDLPIAHRGVT